MHVRYEQALDQRVDVHTARPINNSTATPVLSGGPHPPCSGFPWLASTSLRTTADAVAAEVGGDAMHAGLYPEDKVQKVKELASSHGAVAMVGDGVVGHKGSTLLVTLNGLRLLRRIRR
jgi:hypothetical protein